MMPPPAGVGASNSEGGMPSCHHGTPPDLGKRAEPHAQQPEKQLGFALGFTLGAAFGFSARFALGHQSLSCKHTPKGRQRLDPARGLHLSFRGATSNLLFDGGSGDDSRGISLRACA